MKNYNSMVDYTSLTEKETAQDIVDLCVNAEKLGVKSVCVYPQWVKTAKIALASLGSSVLVCTVISFPKGENSTVDKLIETGLALNHGADEIDMVIDYKKIINDVDFDGSKEYDSMFKELQEMASLCHSKGKILKVIVESGLLTNANVEMLTEMCIDSDCDFIKTSTGKVSVGAEIEKVEIMREVIEAYSLVCSDRIAEKMQIKASGGVRTLEDQNQYAPFVNRFGMGFGSVDQINGVENEVKSDY
jgi:deoxyribose-phosphate aldolase